MWPGIFSFAEKTAPEISLRRRTEMKLHGSLLLEDLACNSLQLAAEQGADDQDDEEPADNSAEENGGIAAGLQQHTRL